MLLWQCQHLHRISWRDMPEQLRCPQSANAGLQRQPPCNFPSAAQPARKPSLSKCCWSAQIRYNPICIFYVCISCSRLHEQLTLCRFNHGTSRAHCSGAHQPSAHDQECRQRAKCKVRLLQSPLRASASVLGVLGRRPQHDWMSTCRVWHSTG